MKTVDRDILTFLGSHYYWLQGLRMVPFGAMLVLWFFLDLFWPKSNARDWAKLATLVAVIASYPLVGAYYVRTFGVVHLESYGRAMLEGAIVFTGYLLCFYIDDKQSAISFVGLLWAAFFLWGYIDSSRRRKHFAWMAALFVALGLLPLTRILTPSQMFIRGAEVGNLAVGIAFVVVGLLDHRLLLRLLPEPSEAGRD